MYLRDPLTYPNWMWMMAVILIVLAVVTIVVALGAANPKRRSRGVKVHPLTVTRRRRYHGFLAEIEQRHATGELSEAETQLALAALVRSAASERTRSDLEALTAAEAALRFPYWSPLQAALQWYEAQVFTGAQAISEASSPADPDNAVVNLNSHSSSSSTSASSTSAPTAPDNTVVNSMGNAADNPASLASTASTASADTGTGGVGVSAAGAKPNPKIQQGVFLAKAVIDQ